MRAVIYLVSGVVTGILLFPQPLLSALGALFQPLPAVQDPGNTVVLVPDADNSYAHTAFLRGTNQVATQTLLRAGLAPDALEKGADLDGDGDPDDIHLRLEVATLSAAPGEHWAFVPKAFGLAVPLLSIAGGKEALYEGKELGRGRPHGEEAHPASREEEVAPEPLGAKEAPLHPEAQAPGGLRHLLPGDPLEAPLQEVERPLPEEEGARAAPVHHVAEGVQEEALKGPLLPGLLQGQAHGKGLLAREAGRGEGGERLVGPIQFS